MQDNKYDKYRVISALDNPKRILMFTFPEIFLLFIPFLIGIFIGGFIGFLIMFSGHYLRKYYNRIKKTFLVLGKKCLKTR